MQTNPQGRWGLRLATFFVWALAAASAAYWGLLLRAPAGGPVAALVPAASAAQVDPARLAQLLGAVQGPAISAPMASASSRFSLIGVVADRSGSGAALIAVDGKPARPYRVGTPVDTGYVLQSVGPRVAVLATSLDAPPAMTLEMTAVRPITSTPGVPPVRFTPPPQPAPPPAAAPATVPNAPGMAPASPNASAGSTGKRSRSFLGRATGDPGRMQSGAQTRTPPVQ